MLAICANEISDSGTFDKNTYTCPDSSSNKFVSLNLKGLFSLNYQNYSGLLCVSENDWEDEIARYASGHAIGTEF